MQDDRHWTVDEVATFLGIPAATLYQWRCRRIGPPGRRIGKHLRYLPDEVRDWVREQR